MVIEILKNPAVKKGIGIASAVASGLIAVDGKLSSQKKEAEYEALKKTVEELKNKVDSM